MLPRMSYYQLADKAEVLAVITAALAIFGRTDTPFNYGVVPDPQGKGQIIYFDLPRISPLQFNVRTGGITERQQLIKMITAAITERMEIA